MIYVIYILMLLISLLIILIPISIVGACIKLYERVKGNANKKKDL